MYIVQSRGITYAFSVLSAVYYPAQVWFRIICIPTHCYTPTSVNKLLALYHTMSLVTVSLGVCFRAIVHFMIWTWLNNESMCSSPTAMAYIY
jgi:hypothetical protein